jgi:hypothetical protein
MRDYGFAVLFGTLLAPFVQLDTGAGPSVNSDGDLLQPDVRGGRGFTTFPELTQLLELFASRSHHPPLSISPYHLLPSLNLTMLRSCCYLPCHCWHYH